MSSAPLLAAALVAALSGRFEAYLAVDVEPSDGFTPPVLGRCSGNGPATAIAHGRVVSVEGADVVLDHVVYENHRRRSVRSTLGPLEQIAVEAGATVRRGQPLGRATRRTRLAIADERDACAFIVARPTLFVPQRERTLILIDHERYRARLYEHGRLVREYAIGFGQAAGAKERRGDNRTPKGMYFVAAKSKGPFSGPAAAYFGGHWIKINYPNRYDAERGHEQSLVTATQARTIAAAWARRRLTVETTALGGGIGFHGWAHEWSEDEDGRHLSWGCVVLHQRDLADFYERVGLGAMVVLF